MFKSSGSLYYQKLRYLNVYVHFHSNLSSSLFNNFVWKVSYVPTNLQLSLYVNPTTSKFLQAPAVN